MYERIKAKYLSEPLLIKPDALEAILEVLDGNKSAPIVRLDSDEDDYEYQDSVTSSYNPDTKVGIIQIEGALTYKPTGLEMMCGGASYTMIEEQFLALAKNGAKIIITMTDTCGGEAYGCMETSDNLRKIADDYGVTWLAYNDGNIASAGYALSASADEIIVNPDSYTGSIGVVVELINDAEAMKMEGYKRIYIYAGENKVAVDNEGEYKPAFLSDVQSKVDRLYSKFVSHVASYRGITEAAVIGTKAMMLTSEDAVSVGLADKIQTRTEFAEYISDLSEKMLAQENGLQKGESMNIFDKFLGVRAEANVGDYAQLKAEYEAFANDAATKYEALEQKYLALMADFEKQQALLKEYEHKVKAEAEQKQAAVANARKQKLQAAFGDAQAEQLFASMSALSDDAFDNVIAAMEKKQEVADQMIEKEHGINAENSVEKPLAEVSGTKRLLEQKFAKTK